MGWGDWLTLPETPGVDEETLKVPVLAACDFLSVLETACRPSDSQFKPLIETRVQGELFEIFL